MEKEKLKQQIRIIIRRNLQSGTPEKIRKQIKELLTEPLRTLRTEQALSLQKKISNNLAKDEIEQLRKEIEKEFEEEFVKSRTEKSEYLSDAKKIIRSASKQTEYLKEKLSQAIFEAVEKGIEEKSDWKEIYKESLYQIDITGLRLETELETHKAALDRLIRVKNLEQTGWEYLEYAGPTGTVRPFCMEHIGRVYHIDEVKKMKNMFGQPALYYQGGYNCRHRWDPVEGQIIEDNKDGRIFAQKEFKESKDGKEITIAKLRLKQLGNNSAIVLNSKIEAKNLKSADAFENGVKTEYKRITEKTLNLTSSLQRALREEKYQAGRIVILIDNRGVVNNKEIIDAQRLAKFWDKQKKLKEIIIIDKEGRQLNNE